MKPLVLVLLAGAIVAFVMSIIEGYKVNWWDVYVLLHIIILTVYAHEKGD